MWGFVGNIANLNEERIAEGLLWISPENENLPK